MNKALVGMTLIVTLSVSRHAFAQNDHVLSVTELKARVAGTTATTIGRSGLLFRWTNKPDGSTIVTRFADHRFNKSHDRSAPAEWMISEAGEYCLTTHWETAGAGAGMDGDHHWCEPVSLAPDGALTLTAPDGSTVTMK